jgi:hypothetical protein
MVELIDEVTRSNNGHDWNSPAVDGLGSWRAVF